MSKKVWIILSVIVVLLGITSVYYFMGQHPSKQAKVTHAIPVESSLLISINDLNKILALEEGSTPLQRDLVKIHPIQKFLSTYFQNSLEENANPFQDLLIEKNKCWVCIQVNQSNEIETMLLTEGILPDIYEITEEKIDENKKSSRIYDDVEIINYTSGEKDLQYAYFQGVLLISDGGSSIESSINQLHSNTELSEDSVFNQLLQTANNFSPLNLFVQHSEIPKLLSALRLKENLFTTDNIVNWASWTEWDLSLTSSSLFFNGFSIVDPDQDQLAKAWSDQEGNTIRLTSGIPANPISHTIYHFDDIEEFWNSKSNFRWNALMESKRTSLLEEWQDKYKVRLDKQFAQFIDEELAFVKTKYNSNNPHSNEFLVLSIKSKSHAEQFLEDLFENKLKQENYYSSFQLDESTAFNIYSIPFKELAFVIGGTQFSSIESNYLSIYKDLLLIGSDKSEIGDYLTEVFRRNTLENNTTYLEFEENIDGDCNIYHYTSLRNSNNYCKNEIILQWEDILMNDETQSNFQALSMQIGASKKNNMISNDIFIHHNPDISDKPQTIWEVSLDTTIHTKPAIVLNHNTNNKEIMVQDLNNKLYLINYAGRTIWEKQLKSKIKSKIYQIDYFKNKKLQYLFNTEDEIHLIDRNGNYVNRYPVLLAHKATNGLSIADYDKNKDYRIFIGTDDNKILLFNKEGNTKSDWQFEGSESDINFEIEHMLVNNKDYIVLHDETRIYALSRRGSERLRIIEKPKPSNNPCFLDESDKSKGTAIVYTGEDGTIYHQYFDESLESEKLEHFSKDHYFLLADLDGDYKNDYIFADGNILKAFDHKGKLLFEKEFDKNISETPAFYQFPNNINKIGVVTAEDNSIYLINKDGDFHPGFPLKGFTSFSISSLQKNGRFTLLVGSSDGFLYQYDVK